MATAPVPEFLVWAPNVGYRGNDIHLVRSGTAEVKSDDLQQYLRVKMTDNTIAPLPQNTIITWNFSVPSPGAFGSGTDTYRNRYGFDPSLVSGAVTLATTPTSRAISNFIILASATIPNVTGDFNTQIRIHIHEDRAQVRLQPSPLRIRKGTALRFSVIVQFSDGIIADVSFHSGLTWQPSSSLVVGADPHSSTTDGERAFQDGGFVSPAPGTTATSGTVKVNLPANLGGPTVPGDGEANVTIIEGWDSLPPLPDGSNPYQAQFIPGGPGIAKKDSAQVRNVLFLSEGFQETEEAVFEQMADHLGMGLRVLPAFRPFDILSFNFFRLWVQPYDDAKRSGVTELQELFPDTPAGQTTGPSPQPLFRGSAVPSPTKVDPGYISPLSSSAKKIEDKVIDLVSQLVYLVGLPIPGEPKGNFTDQTAAWDALYQTNYVDFDTTFINKNPTVPPAAVARWSQLQDRSATLEIDTLFQVATGGRPNADSDPALRTISSHPLRYTREDLDPLLSKVFVVDDKGNQVSLGSLWVDFASKDVGLVCFVTRGQHDAGAAALSGKLSPASPNATRFQRRACAVAMEDNTEPLFQKQFDSFYPATVVGPVASTPSGDLVVTNNQFATVAHELCHSMLCGDEYGSAGVEAGDADRVIIDGFWNLQHVDDVGGGDATDPVEVGAIRWRWPRITTAGVMASAITGSGTSFTVDMLPGHSGLFAKDDQVRFRPAALLTRATPGAILQFQQPTALFQITDRVKDTLSLTLISSGAFTNNSAAGNVLYKPRQSSGSDELIIHPAILSLLGSSGVLSRTSADCDSNAGSDNDPQPPKRTLPSGFRYPRTRTSIIGLYDGGNDRRCGIYHGTGKCMMRSLTWILKAKGKEVTKLSPLCHVCRYVLIDLIDPRRHDTLDSHFAAITASKSP